MKNLTVALFVVLGVLAGFLGGWGYSNAHASSTGSQATNSSRPSGGASGAGGRAFPGGRGFAGAFANGGGVVGQITAINGSTITVHSRITGTDVKVTLSGTTTITHQVTGSASDLAANQTVTVVGTSASDGSISANTIAIQPAPITTPATP